MHSRGFTLIEVLIALAITALVATLSFASLTAVLDSVEGVREARAEIRSVNQFWSLLARDLRQVVPRRVRDEYGEVESAFWGGELADNSLNFTRLGWHNTNGLSRSNMQRVRYVWEDETLYRETFVVLDRTGETEPRRITMLEDVIEFELRFLPQGATLAPDNLDTGDWETTWSSRESAAEDSPWALELMINIDGWGEVRRLFELPRSANSGS